MSQQITLAQTSLPPALAGVADRAHDYMLQSRARNTRRAYGADWRDFAAWCADAGLVALPAKPETVGLYLAARASTHRPATLDRRLVAITAAHRAAGHGLDTRHAAIRETLAGIKRTHGTAQTGKAPAVAADIRAMVEAQLDSLLGCRNRALILLGFDSACRRSELEALDVEDVAFTHNRIVLTLRRSKTDQAGAGRQIGIPYRSNPAMCTFRTVRDWIAAAGISTGALFREIGPGGELVAPYIDALRRQRGERLSGKSIVLVVKAAARAAGLDPARYGGHSLRAGFATAAAQAGAAERSIMQQTGHKRPEMAVAPACNESPRPEFGIGPSKAPRGAPTEYSRRTPGRAPNYWQPCTAPKPSMKVLTSSRAAMRVLVRALHSPAAASQARIESY
jgi:integrase